MSASDLGGSSSGTGFSCASVNSYLIIPTLQSEDYVSSANRIDCWSIPIRAKHMLPPLLLLRSATKQIPNQS